MSCNKAQTVFGQKQIEPETIRDAKKEALGPDQAWDLIQSRKEVVIAKGKKILTFATGGANREEILKLALGRSGTLRAPAVDTGTRIIIGFTEGIYDTL